MPHSNGKGGASSAFSKGNFLGLCVIYSWKMYFKANVTSWLIMKNLTRLFIFCLPLFVCFSLLPGQQSQSFVFDSTLYKFQVSGNQDAGYKLRVTTPKFRTESSPTDTVYLNEVGLSLGSVVPPNQKLVVARSENGKLVFVEWGDTTQAFDPRGTYTFDHDFEYDGEKVSVFRTRLTLPDGDDSGTIAGRIDSLVYGIRISGNDSRLIADGMQEGTLPFTLAHDFSKEAFDIYFFESLQQVWGGNLNAALKSDTDLNTSYQNILNDLYDLTVRYRDISPLLARIDSLELEKDVPAGVLALKEKGFADNLSQKGVGPLVCPPVVFDVKGASVNIVRNKMYLTFSLEESKTHKPALVMFNNFGIPVKSYRYENPYTSRFYCDGQEYEIALDQLIGYSADESTGNFVGNVRNTTLHLHPGDSTILFRRRFGDYFNIVAFTDAIGLVDNESPNSQLLTELDFDLPLSSRHYKKKYFFPYLKASAGFLRLGSKESYRDMSLDTIPVNNATNSTSYFVHQTDLIRFRNFEFSGYTCIGGISGRDGALSAYLEVGGGAIRTRLRRPEGVRIEAGDTIPDFRDFNVWTTYPQVQGRFEVIPNEWLGFDIRVGASAYRTQDKINVSGGDLESEFDNRNYQSLGSGIQDRAYMVYDLNVYVLPGQKKERSNGIYARVRLMDHLTARAFYPQIMIGYGANVRKYIK